MVAPRASAGRPGPSPAAQNAVTGGFAPGGPGPAAARHVGDHRARRGPQTDHAARRADLLGARAAEVQGHVVARRHHDHEVRASSRHGPCAPVRLPVREVRRLHDHGHAGPRHVEPMSSSVWWTSVTATAGSARGARSAPPCRGRALPRRRARRRRAAGRGAPASTTTRRPRTPSRRARDPGRSPAGSPKHSRWVPACGRDDDRLVLQRRDERVVAHLVDAPALGRLLVDVGRRADEAQARVAVRRVLRRPASGRGSSGRRARAGTRTPSAKFAIDEVVEPADGVRRVARRRQRRDRHEDVRRGRGRLEVEALEAWMRPCVKYGSSISASGVPYASIALAALPQRAARRQLGHPVDQRVVLGVLLAAAALKFGSTRCAAFS